MVCWVSGSQVSYGSGEWVGAQHLRHWKLYVYKESVSVHCKIIQMTNLLERAIDLRANKNLSSDIQIE